MALKHLDLFSGIGGFSLGLESTGQFETVAFCEIDDFCKSVLKRNWRNAEIFGDIHSLGGLPLSGFVGRWETPRARRVTEQLRLRPDWVVIENVYHGWRSWMPELRRRLWARGYASMSLRVQACEFGFPHRRSRGFIIANPNSVKLWEFKRWWLWSGRKDSAKLAKPGDYAPRRLGANDGFPDWTYRRKALGNAVVPQIVAAIGRAIIAAENPP